MRDQEAHTHNSILAPDLERQFVELQKKLHVAIATRDDKSGVYKDLSDQLAELSSALGSVDCGDAVAYLTLINQCLSCLNTDIETAGISPRNIAKHEEVLAKAVDQLVTHVIQLQAGVSGSFDTPIMASSLDIASNELRSIFGFDLHFDAIPGLRFNADGAGAYQSRDLEGLSTYSLKNSASILHLIASLELIASQLEADESANRENPEIEIAFGQQLAAAVDNRMLRDAWLLASETYRLLTLGEISPVSPPYCALLSFLKTLCSVDCDFFELKVQRKLSELVYLLAVHAHFTRMECVFAHYGVLEDNEVSRGWRRYTDLNLQLSAPDYYAMTSLVTCLKESIAAAKEAMHNIVESGNPLTLSNQSVQQVVEQLKTLSNAFEFVPFLVREPELKRNVAVIKDTLLESQSNINDQVFDKLAESLVCLEDVLGNQINAISAQGSRKALGVQLSALLNQLQSGAERLAAVQNRPSGESDVALFNLPQCLVQLSGSAGFLGDKRLQGALEALVRGFGNALDSLDNQAQNAVHQDSKFGVLADVCDSLMMATDSFCQGRKMAFTDSLAIAERRIEEIDLAVSTAELESAERDGFATEKNESSLCADAEMPILFDQEQASSNGEGDVVLEADIDDEIAEIFLEEAGEILEYFQASRAGWIETIDSEGFSSDQFFTQLAEVRRHFHTLKGSGRMAAAEHIGHLAWAVENMLNRALDKNVVYTRSHDSLVWKAIDVLPALLESFSQRLVPQVEIDSLIAEADRFADQPGVDADAEAEAAVQHLASSPASSERSTYVMQPVTAPQEHTGEVAPAADDRQLQINDESEFQQEFEEISTKLAAAVDELNADSQSRSAFSLASLQIHTILGSAPIARMDVLGKVARIADEQLTSLALLDELPEYVADALAEYRELFIDTVPSAIRPALDEKSALQRAFDIRDKWKSEQSEPGERIALQQSVQQSDLLFEISGVLEEWRTSPVKGSQFEKLLGEIDGLLGAEKVPAPVEALLIALRRVYKNISGAALSFGSFHLLRQAHEDLENQLSATLIDQEPAYSAAVARLDEFCSRRLQEPRTNPVSPTAATDHQLDFHPVDVDEEILAMFREELSDLLDELRTCFARWEEGGQRYAHLAPFLRPLHTIKGSARMASIDAIAGMAHDLETLIESGESTAGEPAIDSTQFREQYNQLEEKCTAFLSGSVSAPPIAEKKTLVVERRARDRGTQSSSKEMVRVPANVVDRLNNLADENTISRSVIAQRVTDFSDSFEEIDATLNRLRDQLRQLDIETEAQIGSRRRRLEDQDKEGFDPLEMDRYSKLQQLTRALAESASDLKDLYGTQKDSIRNVETMLVQQSRITREMQQSLQQTRTVSLSRVLIPRMRKTLAGLSEELEKPVALSVLNVDGQLDKRILERLVGPIEHILRNAIDHGLESQDERSRLGKKSEGLICVDITRLGGELQIEIRDDGKGINIEAVKAKAIKQKLIDESSQIDEHQLMQMIFQPGFSTAEKLTQISGRGVGLDVVANELKQLGGSVAVASEHGRGTTFTLRIPFNVSMNRALLVACNGETFAIPLDSLQGIVRVSSFELEEQYQNPELVFEYADQEYEFRYLGSALSGHQPQYSLDQYASVPVLLCKAADKLVAYQIDSLLGSREIVLKTLGPKFKPIPGIAGATILGDGSVVTILDLPELFRRSESVTQQAVPVLDTDTKEIANRCKALVVDDSVTVRKVTSRLLERLDVHVTTAKDGLDAMELMENLRPDFVLLDVEMPHLDGFEVLSRMRRDDALSDVPVIMISSRSGEKHRQRARDLGASAFLGKPYQDVQLCATLAEYCEKFAVLYNAQPDDPALLEAG